MRGWEDDGNWRQRNAGHQVVALAIVVARSRGSRGVDMDLPADLGGCSRSKVHAGVEPSLAGRDGAVEVPPPVSRRASEAVR